MRLLWLGAVTVLLCGCPAAPSEAPAGIPTSGARASSKRPPAAGSAAQPQPRAAQPRTGSATIPAAPKPNEGQYLSMRDAKRALRSLYRGQPQRALYSQCTFNDWKLNWSKCCFEGTKKDRQRLEWEHIVPASTFGRTFREWKEGDEECRGRHGRYRGRRCARKASKPFRHMEADMHNLYPAIGEINEARAYYPMAIIAGETRRFGSCDVEVDNKRVEPPPVARGEIARAYLYMNWRYPSFGLLDAKSKALMLEWHSADPSTEFERKRNRYIAKRQRVANPWVR